MLVLDKLKRYLVKPNKYKCSPVLINGSNNGLIATDMYSFKQFVIYHGYLMLLISCFKCDNKLTFWFTYSHYETSHFQIQIRYDPYKVNKIEIDIGDFHIIRVNNFINYSIDRIIKSHNKLNHWIKF